jgi:hypothetical protein
MRDVSIFSLIYTIIGLIVASNQGYLTDLNSLSNLISAILAVLLWPLILLGVNLQINL